MRISDWSSDVCSSDLHPAAEKIVFFAGVEQGFLTSKTPYLPSILFKIEPGLFTTAEGSMEGISLKGRAVAFATGAGAIAFLLALLALSGDPDDRNEIGNALILGIMGGAMCWAAAMRVVSGLRTSIYLVTARLAAAARSEERRVG